MRLSRRTVLAGVASSVAVGKAVAQSAPERETQLDFFGLASHNWQPVIDKFQQDYPNIKIKFTKFGTDEMKQALRVGASSGKMPDIWWNWGGIARLALQPGRARRSKSRRAIDGAASSTRS